ncbi:hypothetical protein J3A98_003414 [Pseudomonas sp. BP6]|nr:hypothetical protein [Pseudomonas sp. BP6]MBP2288308.1 hypothetical protein [Pseudomonas sp. BP7]
MVLPPDHLNGEKLLLVLANQISYTSGRRTVLKH